MCKIPDGKCLFPRLHGGQCIKNKIPKGNAGKNPPQINWNHDTDRSHFFARVSALHFHNRGCHDCTEEGSYGDTVPVCSIQDMGNREKHRGLVNRIVGSFTAGKLIGITAGHMERLGICVSQIAVLKFCFQGDHAGIHNRVTVRDLQTIT